MCRCCQSCLEDIYWNCIEEKFCYDESIANYNPDEDDFVTKDHIKIMPNGRMVNERQTDNNNMPICTQPLNRNNSLMVPSGKIHEEDYRREIQTSVSILAPEILAVFANSQIFQEHQPKGLPRVNTKSYLPAVHSAAIAKDKLENNQEKLIFHLEGATSISKIQYNEIDDGISGDSDSVPSQSQTAGVSEKKIKFTIADNSPLEIVNSSPSAAAQLPPSSTSSSTTTLQKYSIIEEKLEEENFNDLNINENTTNNLNNLDNNEVILRPRLRTDDNSLNYLRKNALENNKLRNVNSFSYFSVRPVASENDIFSISGSGGSYGQLSMTPEVPSISYSALPKNYEDTPTIEKYKESVSLFSIQAANQAEADNKIIDYSMPRYFRKTMTQSVENFQSGTMSNYTSRDNINSNIKKPEKSRRLKHLRDTLPPLLIHTIRKKDETKQVN